MRIVRWTREQARERMPEAMAVYAEAMGYPPIAAQHRTGHALAHTYRTGFRAVAVLGGDTDSPADGVAGGTELFGFGYGYAAEPGQWWHDQVATALAPAVAAEWLRGCFELSELHVRPAAQGNGAGRSMLLTLVEGIPQPAVLLSTPEGDTRAWRLYRSLGFVDLLRHHLFAGDARPFAVLGVRLPLPAAGA